jgi:hypothetical protein
MIVTQIALTLVVLSFLAMAAVSFLMDEDAIDSKGKEFTDIKMRPIDYAMLGCVVVFFISIVVASMGLIWGL